MSGENIPSTSQEAPPPKHRREDVPSARVPLWRSRRLLRFWSMSKDFLSVKNVVLGFMLIVIVAVGLTRGWDAALVEAEKEVVDGALGDEIEAGPFTLIFEGVTTDTTCWDATADYPLCLNVHFRATNTTDQMIEDSAFATHLLDSGMLVVYENDGPIATSVPHPRIQRTIDGLTQGAFQPGITGEYTAIWPISADTNRCDLSLEIKDATWVKSAIDGHRYWQVDDPLLTIPVCEGP